MWYFIKFILLYQWQDNVFVMHPYKHTNERSGSSTYQIYGHIGQWVLNTAPKTTQDEVYWYIHNYVDAEILLWNSGTKTEHYKITLTLEWRISLRTVKTGLAEAVATNWLWCNCKSTVATLQTSSICKYIVNNHLESQRHWCIKVITM